MRKVKLTFYLVYCSVSYSMCKDSFSQCTIRMQNSVRVPTVRTWDPPKAPSCFLSVVPPTCTPQADSHSSGSGAANFTLSRMSCKWSQYVTVWDRLLLLTTVPDPNGSVHHSSLLCTAEYCSMIYMYHCSSIPPSKDSCFGNYEQSCYKLCVQIFVWPWPFLPFLTPDKWDC